MEHVDPKAAKVSAANARTGQFDASTIAEQYRLYIEMMDRIADRRQSANSFFFSLCAGLFAAIAFLFSKDTDESLRPLTWVITLSGVPISIFWHRLLESYRNLGTAKFEVIHQMEEYLPFTAYSTEWKILEEGKNKAKYLPLTHLEVWVPRYFAFAFLALTIWAFPWAFAKPSGASEANVPAHARTQSR